jgi:hypothetical protein
MAVEVEVEVMAEVESEVMEDMAEPEVAEDMAQPEVVVDIMVDMVEDIMGRDMVIIHFTTMTITQVMTLI